MKIPQPKKQGLEEGFHNAVCYSVIDAGTSINQYDGKLKREVILGFKLLDKQYADGNNIKTHKTLTFSMNERSTLYKWLRSWHSGQNINWAEFSCKSLLNKGCMLQVQANENGTTRIVNIMPYQTDATFQDVEIFSLDNYDGGSLPQLDEWKIEKIKNSNEYKEKQNSQPVAYDNALDDDNVPF
jgi:hypothetical protein